jgi:hypothetical protein
MFAIRFVNGHIVHAGVSARHYFILGKAWVYLSLVADQFAATFEFSALTLA